MAPSYIVRTLSGHRINRLVAHHRFTAIEAPPSGRQVVVSSAVVSTAQPARDAP